MPSRRPSRSRGLALFAALVALLAAACSSAPGEDVGTGAEALSTVCGAKSSGAVQGRDVSVYQGNFDWAAQKKAGVDFGYARIGDGVNYTDSQFASNWSKMKKAGVLRGAYQFFEPGQNATTQANLMIKAVGGMLGDGDLPCMIDVETTGGQSGSTIASKVKTWLTLVEKGTGKRPIIYTGPYFWQDNVGSTSFGAYPLWIADYGPSCPLVPNGWSKWTMWQYSDGGGSLDHDVFNGSLATLQKLAGTAAPVYPTVLHREAADIDGDGVSDVCGRSSSGVVCELSQGGAAATEVKGPAWSDAAGWDAASYYDTIQFADVNGDGKGDLCGRDKQGIVCELSTGGGFGAEVRGPDWSDAKGWTKEQYYSTIQFGDINGDGKADVCARAAAGITCALSDGNGFPTAVTGPTWSDANGWNLPQFYSTIRLVDVDGDGKADICGRSKSGVLCKLADGNGFPGAFTGPAWSDASGWAAPQYVTTIRYADVNGDGKTDVCGRSKTGMLCELSDGTGFVTEVKGPTWADSNGWAAEQYFTTIQTADVNGDGMADLCARASKGVVCAVSKGTSFAGAFDGPAWSTASGWDAPKYDSTIGFGDINGDGMDDVCARAASGLTCALSTGTGFADPQPGAAWSDAKGWGAEKYYASLRYAGVKHVDPANPPPPGGPGGGGNGNNPPGGSAQPGQGGGCSAAGGGGTDGAALFLGLGLALVAVRRRRVTL